MDHGRIKAEQRALYEAGEYRALSDTLRPVARELVRVARVEPRHRVLDVGAGDGNLAIEATSVGAAAVGCDLSLVQMRRARRREGRIGWVVGDAERLPFRDGSFDAVLSCFGAVFAPDPQQAVAELFRVVAPGGVVALTSWADDGFIGEVTAAIRASSPSPGSFPDQDLGWGDPESARGHLALDAASVEVRRCTLLIDPAVRGAAGDADCAARYAAQRVTADRGSARAEIATRHQRSDGRIQSDYLLIIGRARG